MRRCEIFCLVERGGRTVILAQKATDDNDTGESQFGWRAASAAKPSFTGVESKTSQRSTNSLCDGDRVYSACGLQQLPPNRANNTTSYFCRRLFGAAVSVNHPSKLYRLVVIRDCTFETKRSSRAGAVWCRHRRGSTFSFRRPGRNSTGAGRRDRPSPGTGPPCRPGPW